MYDLSPIVVYPDLAAGARWLEEVLGFERSAWMETPEGDVQHAELRLGDCVVMPTGPEGAERNGVTAGPAWTYVVVEDADAAHARAVAAGAEVVAPLTDQEYGSRDFSLRDPGGNVWACGTYRPATAG